MPRADDDHCRDHRSPRSSSGSSPSMVAGSRSSSRRRARRRPHSSLRRSAPKSMSRWPISRVGERRESLQANDSKQPSHIDKEKAPLECPAVRAPVPVLVPVRAPARARAPARGLAIVRAVPLRELVPHGPRPFPAPEATARLWLNNLPSPVAVTGERISRAATGPRIIDSPTRDFDASWHTPTSTNRMRGSCAIKLGDCKQTMKTTSQAIPVTVARVVRREKRPEQQWSEHLRRIT